MEILRGSPSCEILGGREFQAEGTARANEQKLDQAKLRTCSGSEQAGQSRRGKKGVGNVGPLDHSDKFEFY